MQPFIKWAGGACLLEFAPNKATIVDINKYLRV